MPIPCLETKYVEKDLVDRCIDGIIDILNGELSESDFNKVACTASVQSGIEQYRQSCSERSDQSLRSEEHRSERLGRHLEQKFGRRPAKSHAHAIVAGKHKYSATLRLRMSKLGIGVDDVDNGCWLPENSAATPHPAMPKAPPHSRIHRYNYYFWIFSRMRRITDTAKFRNALKLTALDLYQASFPKYVMLKKGLDLPSGGRP